MTTARIRRAACLTALAVTAWGPRQARGQHPPPSWNDGATRKAIIDFVARVTRQGGPDFVPPSERIATFDNDGTLRAETPVPFPGSAVASSFFAAGCPKGQ